MKNHWKAIATAVAALAVFAVVYWLFFTSPYTVVNAGDGKIYKVNKRTGETWLLTGNREIPIVDHSVYQESGESRAMRMAKEAETLRMWFDKLWRQFDTNESYVRRMLQINSEIDIQGWKSQKIDGDRYLVSCTYSYKGQPRGYYFEVNLNANTVRDIYADTTLAKQYAEYDIHPAYRIEEIRHGKDSELVKSGKWWANAVEQKIHPVK